MEIQALDAIVYNQEKVDIKDVIAPPYDVISGEYTDELYKRSNYNIVRLILSKAKDRYEDAKESFENWQKNDILVHTDKPSIFYIIQKYKSQNGKVIERKGFIAKNKIESFESKKILPHEYTMGGPKEDRLKLTRACDANFSQIFMVYSDPSMTIENKIVPKYIDKKPFIDVADDNGVQNTVYIIDDADDIKVIQDVLSDKTLLIADGHHRYETAMNYSKESKSPNAQYVMSYFTNADDDNLIIYPTHRIITKFIEPYILLESVKKYFDISEYTFISSNKKEIKEKFLSELEKANEKRISMGLYLKNVNKFYLLQIKDGVLSMVDAPDELKKLDLTVLHDLIISKELGYTKDEQMSQDGIKYIKQEDEAFDMIDKGAAEASFIMAYPKMKDIKDISNAGYRMPQKSTYFYPKLLSGIVINPLW